MPTSSRFAVAVHILTELAVHNGQPVTSETLARSANTNSAVIRRLISVLTSNGITRTLLGTGGGALLVKNPEDVTLLSIYRLTENETLFALHRSEPDRDCAVGRYIQPVLESVLSQAISAMESELARVSIGDIARGIDQRVNSGM
jgi:Rrf2 family protein